MANTTEEQNDLIAKTNWKVIEVLCKELHINIGDVIDKYKSEASFIAAAIRSIVEHQDRKNESDLNSLENQSTEQ